MLICPNGHGPREGHFCPECGAELLAAPPAGDSLRIRSPEAHANASVNPTFILPGAAGGGGAPILVKCPKCGHRNNEADVFDCQGACGRANLCRRHFDEEYDLCKDCAAECRGIAQEEVARQAKLQADLADWRGRAERAEAALMQATQERERAGRELEQTQTRLGRAEQAAAAATADWQTRVAALEKSLTDWRSRAERAEAQLAAIAAKAKAEAEARRQAELKRQQEEVEANRRAVEAARQQPVW
jgi:hypothetical protein